MAEWLVLVAAMLATGAFAGLLAGLFGIGGGVVIVPVLDTALGILGVDPAIRMHMAVGTSLATIIPTSISSSRAHWKRQSVDFDVVKRWSGFVLAGALVGAWMAAQVHSRVLSVVFAAIALLVAARMVFVPEVRSVTDELPKRAWVPVIPALIGICSALMGIGGGVLSVTALTLFGMRIHRAVGTAALLGLAISIPGTLGFMTAGWNDPRVPAGSIGYVSLVGFACIASTTVLTAPLGARIAHAVSERRLSLVFGLFLALVSVRLFLRALT